MKLLSVQLPELATAQSLGERAQDTAAIIGEPRRGRTAAVITTGRKAAMGEQHRPCDDPGEQRQGHTVGVSQ